MSCQNVFGADSSQQEGSGLKNAGEPGLSVWSLQVLPVTAWIKW